jgi:hypothetical protein
MQQHFSMKLRRLITPRPQKLAQEKSLVPQARSARVLGKKSAQLVSKDRSATWFQRHDGHARVYFSPQALHDSREILLGTIEHSKIVERPATTEVPLRNRDLKAGSLQHFERRAAGFRMKIIRKRVRPQNHSAIIRDGCRL